MKKLRRIALINLMVMIIATVLIGITAHISRETIIEMREYLLILFVIVSAFSFGSILTMSEVKKIQVLKKDEFDDL